MKKVKLKFEVRDLQEAKALKQLLGLVGNPTKGMSIFVYYLDGERVGTMGSAAFSDVIYYDANFAEMVSASLSEDSFKRILKEKGHGQEIKASFQMKTKEWWVEVSKYGIRIGCQTWDAEQSQDLHTELTKLIQCLNYVDSNGSEEPTMQGIKLG